MTRGITSEVGEYRLSDNGYWWRRTEDGWRMLHHLVMEEKLGRPLRQGERVVFKEGNRRNRKAYKISNLLLQDVRAKSLTKMRARRDAIRLELEELNKKIAHLEQELNLVDSNGERGITESNEGLTEEDAL